MDYFWIQRDKRYSNLPRIRQFIIRYRASDFNKKRNGRTLPVLKQEYLKRPIMRIRELAPDGVIIRLDVAESLLRRGLYKMNMTRMVIENSEGEG